MIKTSIHREHDKTCSLSLCHALSMLMLFALTAGALHAQAKRPLFSTGVGTQSIGVRYQFSQEPALLETAKAIHELGCDTLKIAVTPKYDDDYMMEKDPSITTLVELVTKKPEYQKVFDLPFRNIMLWMYPFSDKFSGFFKEVLPEAEQKAMYREIFDFTAHILKTQSGSGKSFFFGNWEGDWHMVKENYDYNLDPTPGTIQCAIKWFNLRNRAIQDAIKATPHHDVDVYYYIELNHVYKSMTKGKPTIVNKVLPHIQTDYVSWSSYDVSTEAAKLGGAEGKKLVMDALDFIERHLPPSDIKGKRVMMGEYGFHLGQVKNAREQARCTQRIMQWCLEWGCPFILYWEIYCNEIDPVSKDHRGFWLINEEGVKQPAWHLHKSFLDKANDFVDSYTKEHGTLPSLRQYQTKALAWFKDLEIQ